MTDMPSVSVVIPCYNGHKFLAQTIESVQRQSFPVNEIIVIDDGSNDKETIAYLDLMPDGVRLVRQVNKGLPAARNTGFREATGEYVLPLDCDDWLEVDFIEKGLELITSEPEVSFCFAWLDLEVESRGVLKKNYNFFEQLFLNQLPYSLLQPKRLWEELGGYDETMRQGYEDWEYNIRLGKAGYHGAVIEAPLFHYRVQASGMLASLSRRKHASLWSFIRGKHPDLYSLRSLWRYWKIWRKRKSTRSLHLYFGWELLYRILPLPLFNKLVAKVFSYSHSMKYRTGSS